MQPNQAPPSPPSSRPAPHVTPSANHLQGAQWLLDSPKHCRASLVSALEASELAAKLAWAHPPTTTLAAPLARLAPPRAAPIAPKTSSATVDAATMEYSRSVWSWMKAAASSGMPAPREKEIADVTAACASPCTASVCSHPSDTTRAQLALHIRTTELGIHIAAAPLHNLISPVRHRLSWVLTATRSHHQHHNG